MDIIFWEKRTNDKERRIGRQYLKEKIHSSTVEDDQTKHIFLLETSTKLKNLKRTRAN